VKGSFDINPLHIDLPHSIDIQISNGNNMLENSETLFKMGPS